MIAVILVMGELLHLHSKPPEFVEKLTIHGHYGIDFFLITQSPKLIDPLLRTLVGRHLHIKHSKLGFRKLLEFPECQNEPSSPAVAGLGLVKPYRLKKSVFKLYKSADAHTKQTKSSSKLLYVFLLLLLLTPYLGYRAYMGVTGNDRVKQKVKTAETGLQVASDVQANPPLQQLTNPDIQSPQSLKQEPVGVKPSDYVPRISERPETKPIYDNVRTVVNFEFPEVCVDSKAKCTCYTNQATILREIPEATCKKYVKDGIFNPYKQNIQSTGNTPTGNDDASKVAVL